MRQRVSTNLCGCVRHLPLQPTSSSRMSRDPAKRRASKQAALRPVRQVVQGWARLARLAAGGRSRHTGQVAIACSRGLTPLSGLVVLLLSCAPLGGLVVALLGCAPLGGVSWHPTKL
jgi:hypothetical protein